MFPSRTSHPRSGNLRAGTVANSVLNRTQLRQTPGAHPVASMLELPRTFLWFTPFQKYCSIQIIIPFKDKNNNN